MTTDWHIPQQLLTRFVSAPEALDEATAASVEAHLIGCADCRIEVRRAADPAELAASWGLVADRIDRPAPLVVERVLRRLGVREGMARLVSATPALTGAWFVAVVAIATAAVVVARSTGTDGPYLVLAPLGPLAAVGITFLATSDPAGEAGVTSPLQGFALTLRRAVAVLVPTFLVLAVLGLALPGYGGAIQWILPALALSVGSLAVGTWLRVEVASVGLGVLWVATVTALRRIEGPDVALAETAAFGPAGQLTCLALAVLAAVVVVQRSERYSTLEAR